MRRRRVRDTGTAGEIPQAQRGRAVDGDDVERGGEDGAAQIAMVVRAAAALPEPLALSVVAGLPAVVSTVVSAAVSAVSAVPSVFAGLAVLMVSSVRRI